MTDQPQGPEEEIPNRHIIMELETQLHAKTSELVVANARIRSRDETIRQLRTELTDAHSRAADVLDGRHGPSV